MMNEDVRSLRQASHAIEDEKGKWKRYRRKEILGMRKIDYMLAVEKTLGSIWDATTPRRSSTA